MPPLFLPLRQKWCRLVILSGSGSSFVRGEFTASKRELAAKHMLDLYFSNLIYRNKINFYQNTP
jgi:hypothetical protein